MVCQCGAIIRDDAKFCKQCGRPVAAQSPDPGTASYGGAVPYIPRSEHNPYPYLAPDEPPAYGSQPTVYPQSPVSTGMPYLSDRPEQQAAPSRSVYDGLYTPVTPSYERVSLKKTDDVPAAEEPVPPAAGPAPEADLPPQPEDPVPQPGVRQRRMNAQPAGARPEAEEQPDAPPWSAPAAQPETAAPSREPTIQEILQGIGGRRKGTAPAETGKAGKKTAPPAVRAGGSRPSALRRVLAALLAVIGLAAAGLGVWTLLTKGNESPADKSASRQVVETAAANPDSQAATVPEGSVTHMVDQVVAIGETAVGAVCDPVQKVLDVPTNGGATRVSETLSAVSEDSPSETLIPGNLIWPAIGGGAGLFLIGALLFFVRGRGRKA